MRVTGVALIVFIVCLIWIMLGIFHLLRISQIRGWISGARAVTYTVTQMNEIRGGRSFTKHYYVSWSTEKNVKDVGKHRVLLEYEDWSKLGVGSPIEIVYIGDGDTPYTLAGDASDCELGFEILVMFPAIVVGFFSAHYFVTQQD